MNPPTPSEILTEALGRFGLWLRWLSAMRGMALWTLAVFGVAALSLAVDYAFEPVRGIRMALLAGFASALLLLFVRWVLSPFLVRWSLSTLAAALERRVPAMNERLVTAVEIGEFPPAPALIERVHQEAADLALEVLPTAILSLRSMLRLIMLAMVAGLAVAVLAVTNADFASIWWRRAVLLQPIRYPRQTSIRVGGFTDGVRKIGRGRDVDLIVKTAGRIPERATIELVNNRSGQRRHVLASASAGEFHHRFHSVVQPVDFIVHAGDERTDPLRLEPVDPPAVRAVETIVEPLPYTGLSTKTQPWTNGPVNAPASSSIAIRIAFDGPVAIGDATLAGGPIDARRTSSSECTLSWEVIETARLTVRYANEDGVEGDEPFSVDVVAVPDRPPVFEKFEPVNVGPAVTRLAALPMAVTLVDDYGVEQAATVLSIQATGRVVRIPWPTVAGPTSAQNPVVELGPLELKERDKFTLAMEASDLPPAVPFLGEPLASQWARRMVRSPSFPFEVVAPDELQARLAARELNHRLRFEQTLRECRDARKTLGEAAAARDPGGTLQRLRVEEALQTVRKSANETRELSIAFFGLVDEFRNNRVGASGMLERLERSVAAPLRKLAEDSFPRRVGEIQTAFIALGTPAFPKVAEQAAAGLDALLKDGEAVLSSMRKMENFNELVATLRSLRDEQNKLLQETKEERKRRILDLVK